jgi:hypothetical protein
MRDLSRAAPDLAAWRRSCASATVESGRSDDMTTYESGTAVHGGFYFNPSRWAIEAVAHDGARLPAAPGRWLRVPAMMAMLLTPILGAAFLMVLPLIGFVLAARALAVAGARLLGAPSTTHAPERPDRNARTA